VAWEKGQAYPTYRQLEEIANKLKRPLAAFFLPTVPPSTPLPEDHRTMPGVVAGRFLPDTLLAFREVHNMLEETRGLLDDLGHDTTYSLPQWTLQDRPDPMAETVRSLLGVTLETQIKLKDHYAALDLWRSVLFDHGVIVRICRMPITDVRGFCLFGHGLAGIGLSSEDREHGRIFSLFHELSHLGLCAPGVSGQMTHRSQSAYHIIELEHYCDRFAAAFLMPATHPDVKRSLSGLAHDFSFDSVRNVANRFKVSKYVVARRALDLGYIVDDRYWGAMKKWKSIDQEVAAFEKTKKRGGGDQNVTRLSHAGKRFVALVMDAVNHGYMTMAQANRSTGVGLGMLKEIG